MKYTDISVDVLCGIPARILTVCRQNNIKTLKELSEKSALYWLSQRNIGKKYIQILATVLKSYGLSMPGVKKLGIVLNSSDITQINPFDIETVQSFPSRAKTICRQMGIDTLYQVATLTRKQWSVMRNIGPKTVYEIENALHKHGLSFSDVPSCVI